MQDSEDKIARESVSQQGKISRILPKVICFRHFIGLLSEEVTSRPQPGCSAGLSSASFFPHEFMTDLSCYAIGRRSGNHYVFCAINTISSARLGQMMTDSLVETTAPATTSAAPPIGKALDMQRRNFFPFPVLWFSLVALEISVLAGPRIAEADIWFHLRNAQELLTRHSFLRADLYTFTTAGAPLLNTNGFPNCRTTLLSRPAGLHGLLAVYLVLLWLIFAGVYYLALRRGANAGDAALVTMAGVALGCYSFGPRMLHFGWLCLIVLLLVLERFQQTGKGLWVLPPLFALWINLHGSWVFGFVVMGIYVVSGLVEGQWNNVVAERWTPVQLRKLLLAFAASAVALLANPYGYKLVWYPFESIVHGKGRSSTT